MPNISVTVMMVDLLKKLSAIKILILKVLKMMVLRIWARCWMYCNELWWGLWWRYKTSA